MRIQIGARQTMERLEEMLDGAMDGTFEEDHYDETELSRLESRWKQYIASTHRALEETRREREDMKALVSDISHQTKTPLANILLYGELLEEKAPRRGGEQAGTADTGAGKEAGISHPGPCENVPPGVRHPGDPAREAEP